MHFPLSSSLRLPLLDWNHLVIHFSFSNYNTKLNSLKAVFLFHLAPSTQQADNKYLRSELRLQKDFGDLKGKLQSLTGR